jgi:hypothetical protein
MNSNCFAGRRVTLTLAGLLAVASMVVVLAISGTHDTHADEGHGHGEVTAVAAKSTAKQASLHDGMRKLWEDHITWTRLAIISFAHDLPDLPATQARLLKNQDDIGNAIKPYYGKAAGNKLTALLKEHIVGAVELMTVAKAGDKAGIERESAEWYANGNEIADFLNKANRKNWPKATMRKMMKKHLDDTLSEAVNRLQGKYAADARDYDHIHSHILKMADALTNGIVKQFPKRFR